MDTSKLAKGAVVLHTDLAIHYEGEWVHDNVYHDDASRQSGTYSSTLDANASITFTFTAPAITFTWWGFKSSQGGQHFIRFCDDCNNTNSNWNRVDSFDPIASPSPKIINTDPTRLYAQAFPTSAIYTVQIANSNDTRIISGGFSSMTFISFWIKADLYPTLAVSASNTATAPTEHNTSPTLSIPPSMSKAESLGQIIGGIIAALFFIVATIWLIFFYRRHKRHQALSSPSEPTSTLNIWDVTPFNPSQYESQSSIEDSVHQGKRQVAARLTPPPLVSVSVHQGVALPQGLAGTSEVVLNQSSAPAGATRREVDAGPIALDDNVEANTTLPPDYGDIVWAHQP